MIKQKAAAMQLLLLYDVRDEVSRRKIKTPG